MENKVLLTDPKVYLIMLLIIIYIAVMYGRTIIMRFSNKATIIKLKTVKVEGLVRRKTTHLKQNRLRGQGPVRNSWRSFCVSLELGKTFVQLYKMSSTSSF